MQRKEWFPEPGKTSYKWILSLTRTEAFGKKTENLPFDFLLVSPMNKFNYNPEGKEYIDEVHQG